MASTNLKNIMVIGASGLIGKPIVAALLASSAFTVTALSRPDSTAQFPDGVHIRKVDYSDVEALVNAFQGQDAVVSAVNTFAADMQINFVEAAAQAGVKRFIPSDFGSDYESSKAVEAQIVKASPGKVKTGELLRSKESDGLTWTRVINGPFFDWALPFGFFGFDMKERTAKIYDQDAPARFTTTTRSKVGQAVVSILRHPAETANRFVYPSSFTLTTLELVDHLERVSGKKWTTIPASTYELQKQGNDRMAKGDRYGAYDLIVAALFRQGAGSDYALREKDNELLGLVEEDLHAVLGEVLAKV